MKGTPTHSPILLLAIALMITAGCRKPILEEYLQQHYQVSYYDGYMFASASFNTVVGTPRKVVLDREDRVKANGISTNINADYYGWTLYPVSDVTFTLEVGDNKVLTNRVDRTKIGVVDFVFDSTIVAGDTIRLNLVGAMTADEDLKFYISGPIDSAASASHGTNSGTFSGEIFTFDPTRTSTFTPGRYKLIMAKSITVSLQEAHNGAGGEMEIRVRSERTLVLQ